MKKLKYLMSAICILTFIAYIFAEPTRFTLLTWIFIAFLSVHTNYNE